MQVAGFHHVQIAMPAGEEARAVAFYEDVLGIPQVPKPPRLAARGGCWFESGSAGTTVDSVVPLSTASPLPHAASTKATQNIKPTRPRQIKFRNSRPPRYGPRE